MSSRARAWVGLAFVGLAFVACEETRGDFGDECLANDDCLSQTCVGRVCVNPPAVFSAVADAGAQGRDANSADAGTTPVDAGDQ